MATVSASNAQRVLRYGLARGFVAADAGLAVEAGERGSDDALARIPAAQMYALWAQLVRTLGAPELPIELAREAKLEQHGLLGLCVMTAPSFLDALHSFVRYDALLNQDRRFSLVSVGPRIELSLASAEPLALGVRISHETTFAQVVAALRELCGAEHEPELVSFRHRAPPSVRAHLAHFRAPVRFDQPRDRVVLRRELGALVPPLGNRALWSFLCAQAELSLGKLAPRSLRERTRDQIASALADARTPSMAEAARALALSERSLRRALATEGANFRELVDSARRERARLAMERGAPLIEVALEAGFSEASAFTHAYQRWFGQAPSATRRAGGALPT